VTAIGFGITICKLGIIAGIFFNKSDKKQPLNRDESVAGFEPLEKNGMNPGKSDRHIWSTRDK
jgi:hypothetical protein